MIQAVNLTTPKVTNQKKPSFGSVLLSRVVLQNVAKNGDIYYSILPQTEKGMRGIYQSLALQINGLKNLSFVKKLAQAIPDFNADQPRIGSTQANFFTGFKRYLLTSDDVAGRNDIGELVFRKDLPAATYGYNVREITGDPSRKVKDILGRILGIDIIVDRTPKGKYKISDIEVLPEVQLNYQKPPVKAMVQGEFDF